METVQHLNLAVHLGGKAMTRGVVASNRLMALWPTVIGKKVVMTVTGLVLIGFVIAHMLGDLEVFAGPNELSAYSRFLREVGRPELGYGQLVWVVRIVLFVCVNLHVTAAIQLLARHEAA
jgi:succinate dehydrogenase / fumarate reductase cytochrome b subunit